MQIFLNFFEPEFAVVGISPLFPYD